MTETPLVLSFPVPRGRAVGRSGGKGASVATMTGEGLPVPPGFVISSAAFAAAVDEDGLRARMRARDVAGARAIVVAASPPRELIAEHYATLTGLVAVRSSACPRGSKAPSYAGPPRTEQNVRCLEA